MSIEKGVLKSIVPEQAGIDSEVGVFSRDRTC
jgi:hypothetical protein